MKKQIFLILFSAGLILTLATGCANNNNKEQANNLSITYKDESRNLNNSYTFDEATSKFAYDIEERDENYSLLKKTLIFTANSNYSLLDYNGSVNSMAYTDSNGEILDRPIWVDVELKYNSVSEYGEYVLSNSCVSDIEIYNKNDENYYFYCKNSSLQYTYSYISKVDDVIIKTGIYYLATDLYDNTRNTAEILEILKSATYCFSEDDGKEPYIEDKIINIPMVLGIHIPDASYISGIRIDKSDTLGVEEKTVYLDISDEDSYYIYFHIDYAGEFDTSKFRVINNDPLVKYTYDENSNTNIFIVTSNDIDQMFLISRLDKKSSDYDIIDNYNEFYNTIKKVLIIK